MKKGLFISIEGLDGAGKSTQMKFIKEFLEKKGYKVLITREPGGTNIGEKIRDILLDKEHGEMTDMTEALLYAASRCQHVGEFILPALKKGYVVLCDRFLDSSIAYQGGARKLGVQKIKDINKFATGGLEPDLTIFFDIPPEISLERIPLEEIDRLEQEKIEFHREVYNTYILLAKEEPYRIKAVRAHREVLEISQDIEEILIELIKDINK